MEHMVDGRDLVPDEVGGGRYAEDEDVRVRVSGGGRYCPGVRGTPFRCLLRVFPSESDLGHRFGRSAGYVPGATPS